VSGSDSEAGQVQAFHVETCYHEHKPPALKSAAPVEAPLPGGLSLPVPAEPLMMPVGQALRLRRSCRDFQPAALRLEAVSTLLAAGAGARSDALLKDHTFRTYPSAGALYPVRLYLAALRVEGLPRGVYRYQAASHTFHPSGLSQDVMEADLRRMLDADTLDTGIPAAGLLLFLTAHLPTITSKYGARGYRFALQESGHLGQNLLLAAEALGLGSLALGSYLDDVAARVVGTSLEIEPVMYVVAIGQAVPPLRQALVPSAEVEDEATGHEQQVLAQLLGHVPMDSASADLAESYRAAGRQALRSRPHPWLQWRLETKDPRALLMGRIGEALQALEAEGLILGFWFLVKSDGGQHLRLRVLPATGVPEEQVGARLEQAIAEGQQAQELSRAYRTVYEPELYLFGGPRGLEFIHTLFMLDSRLALEAGGNPKRTADRLSQIWLECMLRHAGLDAFERWDVWKKVCLLRPGDPPAQMVPLIQKMRPALQQLNEAGTADLVRHIEEALPGGKHLCARLAEWGTSLQAAQRYGELTRPLREWLATGIVFHWNRMMYQPLEQLFLSRLWEEATRPLA